MSRSTASRRRWFVLLVLSVTTSACATLPSGRGWGADVRALPPGERVKRAAASTAGDPMTWAPIAMALLLQIDDLDLRLNRWGVTRTPLYGSRTSAAQWSDDLRLVSTVTYAVTALATPSGETTSDWVSNKAKGISVGLVARGLTFGTVRFLKVQTGRTRPDESNDLSFPSGHAAGASVFSTLAIRNTERMTAPTWSKRSIQVISVAAALGTAWARVEAEKHHPSDVLVGTALGHFIGSFMNDAFMGLHVDVAGGRNGGDLRLGVQFD